MRLNAKSKRLKRLDIKTNNDGGRLAIVKASNNQLVEIGIDENLIGKRGQGL